LALNRIALIISVFVSFAASLAVPLVLNEYWTQVAILVWNGVVVAVAWNLLVTTGQISLGHAGFFGLGAYIAALSFLKWGLWTWMAVLAGAAGALLSAILLGLICLRMRGVYLAITTLVFAEAVRTLAIMLPQVTNGSVGLSLPRAFQGNTIYSYYGVLLIVAVSVAITILIKRSSWGLAFSAIRGNEEAANTLGINPVKYKVLSFSVSALITGLAGGYYAFFIGYIGPHEVFNPFISIKSQVMPLVGGLYTVAGPIVGGVILGILGELLRTVAGEVDEFIYGALLLLFVLLWPRGIVGFLSQVVSSRRSRARVVLEQEETEKGEAL
jgi:branched-chain amino acid transport system permease protein